MRLPSFLLALSLTLFGTGLAAPSALAQSEPTPALTLQFGGVEYLHRWSQGVQNDFTPHSDADLKTWRDMLTLNVHEGVRDGDALADLANRVLGTYQSRGGRVLRTFSKLRTDERPAEHLVVVVLGSKDLREAVFARFVLVEGVGVVVIRMHREYGETVGSLMSEWLKANGPTVEQTLMAWDGLPAMAALRKIPRSP